MYCIKLSNISNESSLSEMSNVFNFQTLVVIEKKYSILQYYQNLPTHSLSVFYIILHVLILFYFFHFIERRGGKTKRTGDCHIFSDFTNLQSFTHHFLIGKKNETRQTRRGRGKKTFSIIYLYFGLG